jgi:hypothetical protein
MTHILENSEYRFPYIMEGFVLDTDDKDQMGRMKIWVPTLDGEAYDIDNLPWAEYASPMVGVTTDFPAGRSGVKSSGHVAYGFWSPPKMNSQVLVFLLNGDPTRRFYFSAYADLHRNRSLPAGRNVNEQEQVGPWTDTYDKLEPAASNLKQAFGSGIGSSQAQTRGAWERQVAQDKSTKDGRDGYANSAADPTSYKDPQVYCWTTPGHHAIIMSDSADHCRTRIKTCEGNQIIMDDTNERIYISTAKGNTWIELDEDGHVNIYGAKSVSIRAEEDINLAANRNINLEAQGEINLKAGASLKASGGTLDLSTGGSFKASGCSVDINSTNTKISGDTLNLKSDGSLAISGKNTSIKSVSTLVLSGSAVTSNPPIVPGGTAPDASPAVCAGHASSPSVIPAHEPWTRPVSGNRNPKWKP